MTNVVKLPTKATNPADRMFNEMVFISSEGKWWDLRARQWLSKEAFTERYGGFVTKGSATTYWREGLTRQTADTWAYRPGAPLFFEEGDQLIFNTWDRYGERVVLQAPVEELQHLDELLRVVLGTGIEAQYVRWWLARVAITPLLPPRTGIALIGPPGTGKSTLIQSMMISAIGRKNVAIVGEPELASPFTGYIANGQLLVANEIATGSRADNVRVANKLKGAVTDSHVVVTRKSRDPVTMANPTSVAVTSNNIDALFLDGDDRRWFVAETAPAGEWKPEHTEIARWLETPESAAAVRTWLAATDLETFQRGAAPPSSAGKKVMIEESRSHVDLVLDDVLESAVFADKPEFPKGELEAHVASYMRRPNATVRQQISKAMRTRGWTSGRTNKIKFWVRPR